MPKELFNQPLIVSPNEPDDSDRIAMGTPSSSGGKNITWARLKDLLGDGTGVHVATNADMDTGTNDTKFVSPLKFVYGITTRIFSELTTTSKTIQGAINELFGTLQLKQTVFVGVCETTSLVPTDIILDDIARTLTIQTVNGATISAGNPLKIFTDGGGISVLHTITSPVSCTWDDVKGIKYIYFDTDGILKANTTAWTFGSIAAIYRLYWNPALSGSAKIVRAAIEYHPNTISSSDHQWKHRYGAIWLSGLDLVSTAHPSDVPSSTGVNTCVSLTSGRCMDDNLIYLPTNTTISQPFGQDLGVIIAANITTLNAALMDITYNETDGTLTILPATRFPFHFISDIPQTIAANGTITPVSSGSFFNYYIYSFQDPRFGKVISLRSGDQYTTKAAADGETWEQVKAASPTLQDSEVRQLFKATFEYKSNYDAAVKKTALRSFVDLRQNAAVSVTAAAGATLASNVALVAPSGYTSTNVQAFANETAAKIAAGGGHVIKDEGTTLTQRANLNFVGSQVAVTDNGVDTTIVTISNEIPTVSSGEKVVTKNTNSVNADYTVLEEEVSSAGLTGLDWSSGIATATGTKGQWAVDANFKYECINLNTWIRSAFLLGLTDLYLTPDIDDSGGAKTSAQLDAAYPSALIGQKVWGTNLFVYEKKATNIWRKTSSITA